jgi:hypothetical protein
LASDGEDDEDNEEEQLSSSATGDSLLYKGNDNINWAKLPTAAYLVNLSTPDERDQWAAKVKKTTAKAAVGVFVRTKFKFPPGTTWQSLAPAHRKAIGDLLNFFWPSTEVS